MGSGIALSMAFAALMCGVVIGMAVMERRQSARERRWLEGRYAVIAGRPVALCDVHL